VSRILKIAPPSTDRSEPRYLDAGAIDEPAEALAAATRETLALADLVTEMLGNSMEVFEKDDSRLLKSIERTDDDVDSLHEAIKLYLVRVSAAGLSMDDSRRFVEILTFITHLEHIGDIIDKNLMELAAKKIRNRLAFSREGLDELRQFHQRVADNMKLACNVFTLRDVRLARKLLGEKALLRDAEVHLATEHFARLRVGRPESIETSAIHLDIIRDLKRINSHLTSVAYPILEAAGELLESRLKQRGEGETVARPV
jgi:phosphate:Na+ symporter